MSRVVQLARNRAELNPVIWLQRQYKTLKKISLNFEEISLSLQPQFLEKEVALILTIRNLDGY